MDIFNHKDYEKLWYDRWVEKGCFKAKVSSKKKPYTIMIELVSLSIAHIPIFSISLKIFSKFFFELINLYFGSISFF